MSDTDTCARIGKSGASSGVHLLGIISHCRPELVLEVTTMCAAPRWPAWEVLVGAGLLEISYWSFRVILHKQIHRRHMATDLPSSEPLQWRPTAVASAPLALDHNRNHSRCQMCVCVRACVCVYLSAGRLVGRSGLPTNFRNLLRPPAGRKPARVGRLATRPAVGPDGRVFAQMFYQPIVSCLHGTSAARAAKQCQYFIILSDWQDGRQFERYVRAPGRRRPPPRPIV